MSGKITLRLALFCGGVLGLSLVVTGCVTVATSSAQAVYNHQSLRKTATDQYITLRAYQAIGVDNDQFKDANINIATFNRVVLLSGQVPAAWQKVAAEQVVSKVAADCRIYNLLTVGQPASQWVQVNDAWITTKVKLKLLASADLDATHIKVITENQTVYLMGMLRPREASVAARLASHTEGVARVVKVFSYLNLSAIPAEDG